MLYKAVVLELGRINHKPKLYRIMLLYVCKTTLTLIKTTVTDSGGLFLTVTYLTSCIC